MKRGITARLLIKALKKDGFTHVRTDGSHRRFRHSDGRRVTVSYHKVSSTFTIKTLRSIVFKQVRWNDDDLRRHNFL